MVSSPTSGSLLAYLSEDLNSRKIDTCNDNLQNSQSKDISIDEKKEAIKKLIDTICKYQKLYIKNSLNRLLEKSMKNTEIICHYIIAEQNEINIKELTKEGKIKTLIDITKFSNYKDIDKLTKVNVFSYLNRFKKSEGR